MTHNLNQKSFGAEAQSKVDLTIDQAKDLAGSLLKQGRLGEAQAIVQQLLSARPMDAEILVGRSTVSSLGNASSCSTLLSRSRSKRQTTKSSSLESD